MKPPAYSSMQALPLALLLVLAANAAAVPPPRSISWWFEIGANATTDAANVEALRQHRSTVTRVMPDFDAVKGDVEPDFPNVPATGVGNMYGQIYRYWDFEDEIRAWNAPLQALGVKVLPWAIDISNATIMHEVVYKNSTRFIADALAIAEHFGFQGWHIDYEDERPADHYPNMHEDLRDFLTEFADALHATGRELVVDVATWSTLLSNFSSIAGSSVDQLQDMSFYAREGGYKEDLQRYFAGVKAGNAEGWSTRAGVGIGIYYDGRHGYAREWNETTARAFVAEVSRQGGNALDIFRLNKDGTNDWPYADWWWTVLEDFAAGRL